MRVNPTIVMMYFSYILMGQRSCGPFLLMLFRWNMKCTNWRNDSDIFSLRPKFLRNSVNESYNERLCENVNLWMFCHRWKWGLKHIGKLRVGEGLLGLLKEVLTGNMYSNWTWDNYLHVTKFWEILSIKVTTMKGLENLWNVLKSTRIKFQQHNQQNTGGGGGGWL